MTRLIQMRQRIKAIETIKKVTHAMRLISMSNHSRLKNKEENITRYKNEITNLFVTLKEQVPLWTNPLVSPVNDKKNTLIILIGSQKGLCGNFNSVLFSFFATKKNSFDWKTTDIVTIGKKATDYIQHKQIGTVIATYDNFTATKLQTITQELTDLITKQKKHYSSITVFSNRFKTFFIQNPKQIMLVPLAPEKKTTLIKNHIEDYQWEQKPHVILDTLALLYLNANISYLLFQSLLSEQAARFLSMDTSTRNAESLLDLATLQYNKMRQAKITRELTELTGSFS